MQKCKCFHWSSIVILLESLLEGMAEYYSAELSEKVTRGLKENALKCKYNGGTLPIGYSTDKNQHFVIDPLTAPAILDAFKHYAEGATMQQITDELNLKGIRTKKNTRITLNTVTRMLHNRRYIGEYKYSDITTPNGIPPIVPVDLYRKVLIICLTQFSRVFLQPQPKNDLKLLKEKKANYPYR